MKKYINTALSFQAVIHHLSCYFIENDACTFARFSSKLNMTDLFSVFISFGDIVQRNYINYIELF